MLLKVPERRRRAISLTPLIDVVFILLVFFMLASSFVNWREYEVGTAVSSSGEKSSGEVSDNPPVILRLKADGEWLVDDKPVSGVYAAQTALRALQSERPELRVLVQPEGSVLLQDTVRALDVARIVGADSVSLRPPKPTAASRQGGDAP